MIPSLTVGQTDVIPSLTVGQTGVNLIFCFSHVFDEVQKNSIQIWKYGLYFLTVEYDNKPALAPPFIIFEHIYLSIKWVWKRTCRAEKYNGKQVSI